jgi:transcriptional regulator with XRE-family HTH domain
MSNRTPRMGLSRARKRRGWSQEKAVEQVERKLAEHCSSSTGKRVPAGLLRLDIRQLARWESGETTPRPLYVWLLSEIYGLKPEELNLPPVEEDGDRPDERFNMADTTSLQPDKSRIAPTDEDLTLAVTSLSSRHHLELLRRSLSDAVSDSATSEASLVDWEQTVFDNGRATRDHPPSLMLAGLTSDLIELRCALARCRSSATMRRLTRVVAQMAGLICLTLVKLDSRNEFRNWARTARIAAQEAGDPATCAWVRAQEAYGHYYAGDLVHAIEVARDAQVFAGHAPYVGAALAAALEARAYAALGSGRDTRTALDCAQAVLSRLDADALAPSAFGYNEAQLRFHEGSAFTHLHDTAAAWKAQEQALTLCLPGDYTDRTLTQLDRATCLTHDGDISEAMACAGQALAGLTSEQRRGIITLRAHGIVAALPRRAEQLTAARELRDLIMVATSTEEAADE